jgi:hypothetical protein
MAKSQPSLEDQSRWRSASEVECGGGDWGFLHSMMEGFGVFTVVCSGRVVWLIK